MLVLLLNKFDRKVVACRLVSDVMPTFYAILHTPILFTSVSITVNSAISTYDPRRDLA